MILPPLVFLAATIRLGLIGEYTLAYYGTVINHCRKRFEEQASGLISKAKWWFVS